MINQEIPLFTKTYRLYSNLYKVCRKMPKPDRYNLGSKLENCCLSMLESLIIAEKSDKADKVLCLKMAITKTELLKVFLRLSNEQKTITLKEYLLLQESLQEIGKMLGGWLRYLKNN